MSSVLDELYATIESRRENAPEGSYTARLFSQGVNEIAKKIGEEASEVIVAGLNESEARLVSESADLVYHLLVLLAARKTGWGAVERELARRRGPAVNPDV